MISSQERLQIVTEAAKVIGTNTSWLDAIIRFESNYDPLAINKLDPEAKGLIQFRDEAAQDLGFKDSADLITKLPDFKTQMQGAVIPYFLMRIRQYGPLDTFQRFAMSVFNPAYMNVPPDTLVSAKIHQINPSVFTVKDYLDLVSKRMKLSPTFPLLTLVAAGAALWIATSPKVRKWIGI